MSVAPAGRVTLSTVASRRRAHGWRHAFAPRRLLPVAVTMGVGLIAMALVYFAKTEPLAEVEHALRTGEIHDLNSVGSARDLERSLGSIFPSPADRRFAAERIFAALPAGPQGSHLPNVGALAAIRVAAEPLAQRRDLETFRPRAASALARAAAGRKVEARSVTMPLLTPEQFGELKPAFVVRGPGAFRAAFLLHTLLFLLAFTVMHVAVHVGGRLGDRLLLPLALLLTSLGFVALVSLRDPVRDQLLFARFTQGALMGAIGFMALSRVVYERSGLRRLSLVPLAAALAISAALVMFGTGPTGSDARVNLFGVQPVEVIRLLLVFFLAGWFAERWQFLRELDEPPLGASWWLRLLRLPRLRHVVPVATGVAASTAFFFLQRDLGPALILLGLFLGLYAVSRGGVVLALGGLAAIAAAFALSHAIGYPDTVSLRTTMWLSPWENGVTRGDQIAHALWGFAAGGLSGIGPGLGMPGLMPAAHTDLILAVVGEELGFIGLLACGCVFALLVARGLRIARRAPDPYTMFLALGITLGMALQTLLIAAGVLGLLPLAGVGTPFLSYGRSALAMNLAGLGILWSISASAAPEEGGSRRKEFDSRDVTPTRAFAAAFVTPLRALTVVLALLAGAVVARAAWVQVVHADTTLGRGHLARQADGELRYQYNPRLLHVAASLPRGDIYDRNGVLLATNRWSKLEANREPLRRLGVEITRTCAPADPRHYPFGGATYHVLGDWVSRRNWGASNTAFLERSEDDHLSGYDDHARAVTIWDRQDRQRRRVVRRNLAELVPLWRHRYQPRHPEVVAFMKRERDVRTTLDIRLQLRIAARLRDRLREAGLEKGAVVVLDANRGEVLASVSLPAPEGPLRGRVQRLTAAAIVDTGSDSKPGPLLDRARFGLYPPGSTFKLVTAAAALEHNPPLAGTRFVCRELPDGRVGNVVGHRVVRDDPTDHAHGEIDLEQATIVSCNAYFAQLGRKVGWSGLETMAYRFGISVGNPPPKERPMHLIEASYGQAQVLASPYRMARVAAAIANAGQIPGARWVLTPSDSEAAVPAVTPVTAGILAGYMRAVVERGTAHRLAPVMPPIAGKTGTAQVADEPSHSWFVGYTPYGRATRRIAFAVVVENGGYGGVRAAEVAGDLVAAARELGITP